MTDDHRKMLSQQDIVAINESFFSPIGPTLVALALQHNLFLEK